MRKTASLVIDRAVLFLAAIVVWCLLFLCKMAIAGESGGTAAPPTAAAQDPDWQRLAPAVVRVRAGNNAGSGCLVWRDATGGLIVTAAHVTNGDWQPTIRWFNGVDTKARNLGEWPNEDIALLRVETPQSPVTIPLACEHARQLQVAHVLGFGGGRLFHAKSTVAGYEQISADSYRLKLTDPVSVSGDSGGAILVDGHLVSIVEGACLAQQHGPALDTHGPAITHIRAAVRHVAPEALHQCTIGGCRIGGVIRRPPQRQPVVVRPSPRPSPNPATVPATPPNPAAVDFELLASKLLERMATDPRFRGPPGPAGADGNDGAAGKVDVDALAAELLERLPPLTIERYDQDGRLLQSKTYKPGQPVIWQERPRP